MPVQNKYLGYTKRLVNFLKAGWFMVFLTLLLLISLEGVLTLVINIRRSVLSPTTIEDPMDERAKADGYYGATWTKDYFEEFSRSSSAKWESYVYWRRNPFDGKYINITREGLRQTSHPEYLINDTSKPLKVFMFGGSTMWGTGARDEYTIPSLFSNIVSNNGVNVEVSNFGETGYVSTQEVIALMLQLQKGNIPDIVIFYDGANDSFSAFQQGVVGLPQNEKNRENEFNLLNSSRYNDFRRLFLLETFNRYSQRSGIFKLAKKIRRRIMTDDLAGKDHDGTLDEGKEFGSQEVVSHYLGNVRIVESLSKTYEFIPVFYWQPVIYTKPSLTPYEKLQMEKRGEEVKEFYSRTYSIMNDRTPEFTGHYFYNISDIFVGVDDPLFIDTLHLTEKGNEIIANRMASDILAIDDINK